MNEGRTGLCFDSSGGTVKLCKWNIVYPLKNTATPEDTSAHTTSPVDKQKWLEVLLVCRISHPS